MMLLTIYWINRNKLESDFVVCGLEMTRYLTLILVILICGKPAAVFISLLFETIFESAECTDRQANSNEENDSVKIGALIGILEREIILILGIMGQYGAIGFVLTAKSLARFKQLEKQSFAEKYLVGTLLSSLIAIVCIAIVNWMS